MQTADEYRVRLMTLLKSTEIDRRPSSDDRMVLIDDDADRSILLETRASMRARYGSDLRSQTPRGVSSGFPGPENPPNLRTSDALCTLLAGIAAHPGDLRLSIRRTAS
jgi:hypothetical protein